MADQTIGAKITKAEEAIAAALALILNCFCHLPSERATMIPKTARLDPHTQREPPREPVTLYHWTNPTDPAKEFPSTSQGHEI